MALRRLLWTDCTAGAVVGVVVLAFSGWLSDLYALPRGVLLFTGAVNLLYASYSFSLAVRDRPPRSGVTLLIVANASWAVVCGILGMVFWEERTAFGLVHLIGEGRFVGLLAAWEWSAREFALVAA